MVMFFPKKASFSLTFLPRLLPFLFIFLASYPNCSAICCQVHKDRCQTLSPSVQTLIQLLYYTTAREERRYTNVRVVGWRAALLQCGVQTIDKERDIKKAKSDARILSNGPTQARPIIGVLQLLTIRGCYFSFTLILGVHAKCIFHSSPRWSRHWHKAKMLSLSQCSPSFPYKWPTCRVRVQPPQHSHLP